MAMLTRPARPSAFSVFRNRSFTQLWIAQFISRIGSGLIAIAAQDGARPALEALNAGDFFGKIAAQTGVLRTANVVTEHPTVVLQVPAATLQQMIADPWVRRYILNWMTERLVRRDLIDLPRFPSLDLQALRELRTLEPLPAPGP